MKTKKTPPVSVTWTNGKGFKTCVARFSSRDTKLGLYFRSLPFEHTSTSKLRGADIVLACQNKMRGAQAESC